MKKKHVAFALAAAMAVTKMCIRDRCKCNKGIERNLKEFYFFYHECPLTEDRCLH